MEPLLLLIEFVPEKNIFDDEEDETSFHDLKKSTCKSVISVTTNGNIKKLYKILYVFLIIILLFLYKQ